MGSPEKDVWEELECILRNRWLPPAYTSIEKVQMTEDIKTNWLIEKVESKEEGKLLDIQFIHRYDPRWRHCIQMSAEKWFKAQHAEFKLGELTKKLQPVLNYIDGRYEDG